MTKVYSIIDEYGTIEWFEEGTLRRHADDGPAVEFNNGEKWWYKNGKCHRTDGPAREFIGGTKEYWLNGRWYFNIKTDEEWIIFQILN